MARNLKSEEFLMNKLTKLNKDIGIVTYKDVYETINFLCNVAQTSLTGQNIVLDCGLENYESFHIIEKLAQNL